MSENKRQFETVTAINYKSKGTAATYLRYCDIFNENLLQIHCRVCLWKNFKISQHLAELQARSWLPHVLSVSGHCPAERRSRHISWVWQETAAVNCCYIDFVLA